MKIFAKKRRQIAFTVGYYAYDVELIVTGAPYDRLLCPIIFFAYTFL